MTKILTTILFTLSLLFSIGYADVKEADLAGQWYASSPEALRAELNAYLEKADPPKISGKIIAVISPHAGLRYSGPIAAYSFKAVQGMGVETVVVIGISHRMSYDGIAVLDEDGFRTPLGTSEIDRDITASLMEESPKIYNYPAAFSGENSVEMEMPFIQAVFKDVKVVLIAIGEQSFENSRILGEALYNVLKDNNEFLLVASTDMSHYLPYGDANRQDEKTIGSLEKFDPDALYAESVAAHHRLMCGYGAVCAAMIASEKLGADKVEILKYANSGDTARDKSRVVGYLSAAFVRRTRDERRGTKEGGNNMLNEEQKKKMLKLARASIMHYLKTGGRLDTKEGDPVLNEEMGAFVTLHRRGALRGCIGNMVGRGPFYLTVRDMAIEAATGDPRFRLVTLDEMDEIDIEISALSPLKKIKNPDVIEAGKHGVIVKQGFRSGVYLPQVATEQGWDREQFMNSLCGQKAGMDADAWKKGDCDIYIFTAEVFGEKKK